MSGDSLAVTPPVTGQPRRGCAARGVIGRFGILTVFVVALGVIATFAPALLTADNMALVLRQSSIIGVMAVGATLVMVAGRLDLSIGALLSLASTVAITLHESGGPGAAVVGVLACGAVAGLINGLIVGYLRLNPLIATLATMSLLQGATLIYGGGRNVYVAAADATWFTVFGRGYLLGIPVPVLIFAALAILLGVALHMTPFGRRIFAIGGNEIAAAHAGIDVPYTVATAYALGGLLTGVAALIIASRVMGAQANTGDGYQFAVISAVILGGTSFLGGSGTMAGTVAGVVLLAFMQNGLLLLGLPYYIQWLVTWAVIIPAVWLELAARRRRLFL